MKKMTCSSVQERLELWIKDDHYKVVSDRQALVEEKGVNGEASVVCTLPAVHAYELTLEGKAITHLKSQRCADGIFIIESSPGCWELHIVECKKTVNKSKWKTVKLQCEVSMQRAMALLASIGIFPEKIKLYTAFREEPIQEDIAADPVLGKLDLDGWRSLSDEEKEKLHFMDWLATGIDIWTKEDVPHERVLLDSEGKGMLEIQCI